MSRDKIQITLHAITSARAFGRDGVTLETVSLETSLAHDPIYSLDCIQEYNTNPGNKIMTILNFVLFDMIYGNPSTDIENEEFTDFKRGQTKTWKHY